MTDQRHRDSRLKPQTNADAIRDEQAAAALRQLDADEELPPKQRAVVERLADRLTTDLCAMFDADEQSSPDMAVGEHTRERLLCRD